jgi:hypothetical protein
VALTREPRSRLSAEVITPRWINVCGKFSRNAPLAGSISSA